MVELGTLNADGTLTPATDPVKDGTTSPGDRADRREYKIQGTAQDTTANKVDVRTSAGDVIRLDVPGNELDGTWRVDLRNGPTLPADNQINVKSDSGADLTTAVTRSR